MEVTPVNFLLNRTSESHSFEEELDAKSDASTDFADSEVKEQDCEDKKVNCLVEKRGLIKKVARVQTFGQHKNKSAQAKRTLRRDEKFELESQSLAYNQLIANTFEGMPFSSDKVLKQPIATNLMSHPSLSGEHRSKWCIEAQLNATYQAIPCVFNLSDCLFYHTQKLNSYRVLFRNRYYLFEFKGGEMKKYCEVKRDCA